MIQTFNAYLLQFFLIAKFVDICFFNDNIDKLLIFSLAERCTGKRETICIPMANMHHPRYILYIVYIVAIQ